MDALSNDPHGDRVCARRWLGLAISSLVIAGCLSLLLVIGRAPGLDQLFTSALFFKRCLVVHVDLALVVWFASYLACLLFLVPGRTRPLAVTRWSGLIGAIGVGLTVLAAVVPDAEPVLSNYVPIVDHPVYLVGLAVFALGVLLAVLDARLLPANEAAEGFFPTPPAARVGIRAAALLLVVAAITFVGSVLTTPRTLPTQSYYELVAWGGGHELQTASIAGMLANWIILVSLGSGRAPVSRRAASILFALLAIPMLIGPLLAIWGTTRPPYYDAFTTLMRWGIWPVVTVMLLLIVRSLRDARRDGISLRDPNLAAFFASAALAIVGFLLGATIRGADTRVPAHYHASIGAVTVTCMALTWPLLERLGMGLAPGRLRSLVRWQPVLFAVGQAVFAVGFGFAGLHGSGRKTYGVEQHVRGLGEWVGLSVMVAGGVVAVAAGVLFLFAVVRAWRARPPSTALAPLESSQGGVPWKAASIPSRG